MQHHNTAVTADYCAHISHSAASGWPSTRLQHRRSPKSGNWQSIPFLCRHGGQWPHPDVHLLVPDIITPNGLVYRDRQEPVNWFRCYHRRKCAVLPPVPVRVGCWSVDFLHVSAGLWLGLQDSRRVLSRQQNFSVSCAWHSAERHNSNGG
jgi:hypothetical protein